MAVIDSAEMLLRANRYSGSGDWVDESGNGHDATPVGSPTWDGEKFTLNGTSQYFTVPDSPSLDVGVGEDLTVVAVVTVDATLATAGRIVHKRSGNTGWELHYDTVSTGIGIFVGDGTTSVNPALAGVTAGTRQTTSTRIDRGAGVAKLGIDGSYANSGSIAAIGDLSNALSVYIGRWNTSTLYFKGDVYGVAIFTTSLSDADVATAGTELTALPAPNRMGGTGAIRKPPRY